MENSSARAIKVYFEVTNYCNFRCDFCPIDESRRRGKHMDYALLTKGIDDVDREGIADTIGFHVLGEPLLYPRVHDAISYANGRGLRTELHTNGSLLSEDRINMLHDAALDKLVISLQVVEEADHVCRGTRIPFGKYYEGVMNAIRLIAEAGSGMETELCIMNTFTKRFFDVDKAIRMNGNGGAFRRRVESLVFDASAAAGRSVSKREAGRALRRLNLKLPQHILVGDRVTIFAQPFADWGNAFTTRKVFPARLGCCGFALSSVGILSNGQVTICCADYDGHTSLGNLRTESLAALLSSDKARTIRQGFDEMKIVHPYCQRCFGSTNRIKALFKGLASIYFFRMLKFQPAKVKEVTALQAV